MSESFFYKKSFLVFLTVIIAVLFFVCLFHQPAYAEEENFTSIYELDGKRIGVLIGTIHDQSVKNIIGNAKFYFYNSYTEEEIALKKAKTPGLNTKIFRI